MKNNLVATALVAAVAVAAPIMASAHSRHHYQRPLSGYGTPTSERDLKRSYAPSGYDPDPALEAALRKDRASGMIDFPGVGR
jgi:hypothetical protein